MAISFSSVRCPECGAILEIEVGRNSIFCSYCGAQVLATDENEYTYRYIDEAKMVKSDNDTKVRMRELDIEEKALSGSSVNRTLLVIWLAVTFIIFVICLLTWAFYEGIYAIFVLFYVGGPIIGGGAYLIFKLIPDKENERYNKRRRR